MHGYNNVQFGSEVKTTHTRTHAPFCSRVETVARLVYTGNGKTKRQGEDIYRTVGVHLDGRAKICEVDVPARVQEKVFNLEKVAGYTKEGAGVAISA